MSQQYTIKQQLSEQGPREKIIENGPDTLTNAELLAIVFVTGTRDENVIELSSRVINEYGSRSIANIKNVSKVIELLGLGKSKACQLVAVFELGRRFYLEQSSRMPKVLNPDDVFKILKHMGDLKKEEFRVLYLNSRQRVISEELLSLGSENMNIISPKEVLHPAVELLAKGIIMVHNHPSGEIQPSSEDIRFTERMISASDLLGISMLDHIIIGSNGYTSLKTEGFIA